MASNTFSQPLGSSPETATYPTDELIAFIERNYDEAPRHEDVRLLEFGCGNSGNLWYLAREGFTIWGVDRSATAIAATKARLDKECPGWKEQLTVGDFARSLPYPDGFFHAVIDDEAVSRLGWNDALLAYREAHRLLEPRGRLFSRALASGTLRGITGPLVADQHVRYTRREDIQVLLKPFSAVTVELRTLTRDDGKDETSEWIIEATKG
jgi:SAM-dependent methyltransferase